MAVAGTNPRSRLPGSPCTSPTRANLSRSTPRLCTSTGTLFFPTHVHRICSDVAALRIRAIVQRTQILKNFRSSCRESMDTVSSCRKHRPRQHYRPRLRTHASATDHPVPLACARTPQYHPYYFCTRFHQVMLQEFVTMLHGVLLDLIDAQKKGFMDRRGKDTSVACT